MKKSQTEILMKYLSFRNKEYKKLEDFSKPFDKDTRLKINMYNNFIKDLINCMYDDALLQLDISIFDL